MPYPAQIDAEQIIAQARAMIEQEGADNLSLHKLAATLGVKAPSLYRYFDNKTDLLRAVNLGTARGFGAALSAAIEKAGGDPRDRVLAMAMAARDFAHANPRCYQLAYSSASPELRPDEQALAAVAIPLQQVISEISGEANSLSALRGAWALVHGFVLMEINGQFQRGGDLSLAFRQVVEAYVDGWRGKR